MSLTKAITAGVLNSIYELQFGDDLTATFFDSAIVIGVESIADYLMQLLSGTIPMLGRYYNAARSVLVSALLTLIQQYAGDGGDMMASFIKYLFVDLAASSLSMQLVSDVDLAIDTASSVGSIL